MGFFTKPLLPGHYENEDVQVSCELCTNIAINVIGLARGEIMIMSGNDDMIQINTSVQAKASILKNAAALDPVQDGNQYTYTIHTPLESKLERSVTFQVFVTIPRRLETLESFTITGTNIELSIGNISHTFIQRFSIMNMRGDVTIESFYGESATIKNSGSGCIFGKYSVARLHANTKSGKIHSDVRLLNTDEQQPAPKVVCATLHHPVNVTVDGTDLFGPFTVEAKTQCQSLDVKILLANKEQRLLGNFINFGAPTRIRLSSNFQGRIEARTHYGNILINEPEFERIDGAMLTIPSQSDRNAPLSPLASSNASSVSSAASSTHLNTPNSSGVSTPCSTVRDKDDLRHQQNYLNHPYNGFQYNYSSGHKSSHSDPVSNAGSEASSRAGSITGSLTETRSIHTTKSGKESKKMKNEDKDSPVTKEVIGTIGHGAGFIVAKNSSGNISLSLI
ncbi:hypothetical protein BGZ50_009532 [Haplosporangium sp. Z 11]|nr:hypothetical protein BGZ50_009532 [Haplosporangium sp. Z 11]